MNPPGASDLLVQARSALLDALEALREHRDAIVLIGAQAIYLHTGRADIALAEATKDSDLALDMRNLADHTVRAYSCWSDGWWSVLGRLWAVSADRPQPRGALLDRPRPSTAARVRCSASGHKPA
jgi:hypothetical protein